METEKFHMPSNVQRLWVLLSGNGQPFNKNRTAYIVLIMAASLALGIFVVNITKLVNSSPPVESTVITRTEAAPTIENPFGESSQTAPQAAQVKTAPVQTAPQAARVEAAPIQTAPSVSIEEKPAAPEAEAPDRFTIDKHLYRAKGYEVRGEYSKALASYRKVLDIEKNNLIVLSSISFIYLQLDLPGESIEYSERALNVNRDYVPALTNMAIALAKTGDLPAAEDLFTRALGLEPANQEVRLNLAMLLEREERFPEAAENYTSLVKAGNVSGALGLARVYEKEERLAEAVQFYRNIYNNDSIDGNTRAFVRKRIIILQNDLRRKSGR